MADRLINVIRRFGVARAAHPESGDLMAFRDGQLGERSRRRIALHLTRCARCSRELDQLEQTLNRFREAYLADADAELPDLWAARERLQSSIRAYQGAPSPVSESARGASFAHTALGQALAAELGVYLGTLAAVDVLDRVRQEHPDGPAVVTAIEPALTTFLGRPTASAVATKLLGMLEVDAEPGGGSPLPDVG